ncbi:hypothetical protein AB5J49_07790 [Streptomyces sp. R28]|uniref:Uncharacterized protein n=1 Tax=Streptomyces sp. R28 TaxID=3238628 RepID=A0AB39PVN6_9ACTN
MSADRKRIITLTPAAEVALANIREHTYGAMTEDFAVSHALVMLWEVMELEERGEELRTRREDGKGRTKSFKVDSNKVPRPYVR